MCVCVYVMQVYALPTCSYEHCMYEYAYEGLSYTCSSVGKTFDYINHWFESQAHVGIKFVFFLFQKTHNVIAPHLQVFALGTDQLLQHIVQHGYHSVHNDWNHKRFLGVCSDELHGLHCFSSKKVSVSGHHFSFF